MIDYPSTKVRSIFRSINQKHFLSSIPFQLQVSYNNNEFKTSFPCILIQRPVPHPYTVCFRFYERDVFTQIRKHAQEQGGFTMVPFCLKSSRLCFHGTPTALCRSPSRVLRLLAEASTLFKSSPICLNFCWFSLCKRPRSNHSLLRSQKDSNEAADA